MQVRGGVQNCQGSMGESGKQSNSLTQLLTVGSLHTGISFLTYATLDRGTTVQIPVTRVPDKARKIYIQE